MMKNQIAELLTKEVHEETRPFKIVGVGHLPEGHEPPYLIIVEYQDVFEYKNVYLPAGLTEHLADGWGVENTAMDSDGDWNYLLRRVRPATESAADDD